MIEPSMQMGLIDSRIGKRWRLQSVEQIGARYRIIYRNTENKTHLIRVYWMKMTGVWKLEHQTFDVDVNGIWFPR